MIPAQYFFPVFKGLQKPLEFMGLRGRFLNLAGMVAGGSFGGFCVGALVFSKGVGFAFMLLTLGIGYLSLKLKQRQGLHSKQKSKDILIYQKLFINK